MPDRDSLQISSFGKRVKRRIAGRKHSFFAVCTPGLKKICFNEMLGAGFPENDLKITPGGIDFNARLNSCTAFNLNLRSPLRVLMRISTFKADSFKKFEKKINAIDWILYLPQNCSLKFNVTSKKSRLYHSNALAHRCEQIIFNQLQAEEGFTAEKQSIQTIYIRAEHDFFTISLDSTGELLFKRGVKKKVIKAPLRENIAFAMLSWAGFSNKDILIDPMCGSGTFSIEAAMIQSNIPSGFFRTFAFEHWPVFSVKTFAHMKKQALENCLKLTEKQIFASDIDAAALAVLEQNCANHDFCKIINASKKDFFAINPSEIFNGISHNRKGIIMLNPPYGKRLKSQDDNGSFYREIGKKLKKDFTGWRVGIILPSSKSKTSLGIKLDLKPLFHGGLDIFAGIGRIQ